LPDLEAACGAARAVAEHFWVFLPRHLRQESLTIEIEEDTGQGYTSVCFPGSERR
jgi:hypothetical protein